jgi:hypothetical protein
MLVSIWCFDLNTHHIIQLYYGRRYDDFQYYYVFEIVGVDENMIDRDRFFSAMCKILL